MRLFQKPAATPAEVARSEPLELTPAEVNELDEDAWYARAYRGDDVPQLTVRAVLTGTGLGFVLAFTNVYVGLKTGWSMNVALAACILSFALWNALVQVGAARSRMSILESNCMQSTASAAGYSTGTMTAASVPALLLLSVTTADPRGHRLSWPVLAAWILLVALLGVTIAIPMKRNLINRERLAFPSGTAAATMLQSLYTQTGEALRKARALLYAALVAGTTPLLMDLKVRAAGALLPAETHLFDFLPARGVDPRTGARLLPSDWTVVLDHKLVMVAAGMMAGLRVCASMLLAAILLAFVVGPAGLAAGAVSVPAAAWSDVGVWIGSPILVVSGLLALVFEWRTVVRAFRGFMRASEGSRARTEVPNSWCIVGVTVAGIGLSWLGATQFGIPWPLGILAVLMTAALSLVTCRATGESDFTPVGPVGNLTQLTFGVLLPHNATATLVAAGTTASAAGSSADLLTDLKAGYLLGANPRRQFVAQFLGIFSGTVATTLAFYLLIPDATAITGTATTPPSFPAPAAQAWLALARLFERGLETLPPFTRQAILWSALAAVVLAVLEAILPRYRRFIPSATGLGLGFILPFQYPLSFFIGAAAVFIWRARRKESADRYVIPVSSGFIAGESIVGMVVVVLNNFVLRR
jgi:putative OPT family oligopeptide transporter